MTSWAGRVDLDALLVALVLVPHSYSRNRFFGLYRWPPARRVRRRAALLRSIVSDFVLGPTGQRAVGARQVTLADGDIMLAYQLPALGVERTARITPDEAALLKLAIARAAPHTEAQQLSPGPVASVARGCPPDAANADRVTVDAGWQRVDARELAELEQRANRVLSRLLHAPLVAERYSTGARRR